MLGCTPPTDADPHFTLHPEGESEALLVPKVSRAHKEPPLSDDIDSLLPADKTKLLYHVNILTDVYYLRIPPSVALNILTIAYREGYAGFSPYYKIITRSWFI